MLWARPFRNFAKAYEAEQANDLDNLDKQTLALTSMQCFTLILGIWSSATSGDDIWSSAGAANATTASSSNSSSAPTNAQHDAISALFVITMAASTATMLLFMHRVRRNSKKAKADGLEVHLPEGWKWFDCECELLTPLLVHFHVTSSCTALIHDSHLYLYMCLYMYLYMH